MMVRPDGRFEIVARSGVIMISDNGILGPYKLQGHSIYPGIADLPTRNLEDPVIWYSGACIISWSIAGATARHSC